MTEFVREKLQIGEYIYPFADKINPLLYSQIALLDDYNYKPPNIHAQFTGWHLDSKESNTLLQWVSNLITHDFLWSAYTLKCVELWGVLYKKGDYITSHNHTPSLFSFVYYVNAPKGSSPLVFVTSGRKIKPAAGKVVIFESRLNHAVPKTKSTDRCIISGNFVWDKGVGVYNLSR